MITIEQAAQTLGLSERQTYRRISSARPILSPYLRRGPNNALLLDPGALEILRRAEDLRRAGVTIETALTTITEEMAGKLGGEPGNTAGKPAGEVAALRELIETLKAELVEIRRDRDSWRELALSARPGLPSTTESRTPLQRLWASIFGARS